MTISNVTKLAACLLIAFAEGAFGQDRTIIVDTPSAGVDSFAFSPNSTLIATAGHPDLFIWDAKTGKLVRRFEGHVRQTHCVAFSPDGSRLATGDMFAGIVKLWDFSTGKSLWSHAAYRDAELVSSVNFSPDGRHLVSGGGDGKILIWDVATGKQLPSPKPHRRMVSAAVYFRDGERLLTAGIDNELKLWRVDDLSNLWTVKYDPDQISPLREGSAAIAQDRNEIVALFDYRTIKVFNTNSGEVVRELVPATDERLRSLINLAVSPDGRYVAAGVSGAKQNTGQLLLWDLASARQLKELDVSDRTWVNHVAFSPDGKYLAISDGNALTDGGSVKMWEVRTLSGK